MTVSDGHTHRADIVVVGAGVLGTAVAYWLTSLYDAKVLLLDKERAPGLHASSRNTGVIHRPFYLDPVKKRVFALTALESYPLWKELARLYGLPWKSVGTLNVALSEDELNTIKKYRAWGMENGVPEGELALLDSAEVNAREPEVKCRSALLSRSDVSVDFGGFTRALQAISSRNGAEFLGAPAVDSVQVLPEGRLILTLISGGRRTSVSCGFMVNAAGGGALRIAHGLGLGAHLSEMNFRGEYWVVDDPFATRVGTNVYRPPRYPQFPFLDPLIVVRANGKRHIGPNAVLVTGPYVYSGVGLSRVASLLDRPMTPKLNLLSNPSFMSLLAREWRSSLSKSAMCSRVMEFVPALSPRMLHRRAVFGVRSSVVDSHGFVPEAVILSDQQSVHIVNYNSPGATGAPAFGALVVKRVAGSGALDAFPKKKAAPSGLPWDFEALSAKLP